jgi:hypothetical protein
MNYEKPEITDCGSVVGSMAAVEATDTADSASFEQPDQDS